MSYLDRIREANVHSYAGFLPLRVAGERVGCVRESFAALLADHPAVFDVRRDEVRLAPALDVPHADPADRTAAAAGVLETLRRQGAITGWRGERYAVRSPDGGPALLEIERAAAPHLGVRSFAVHVNGFVREGDALGMWIARRSATKPTDPGKLDHLVAGGLAAALSVEENLVKECAEEAAIPASLARGARPVGLVSYALETREGLRPDVVYCYDLEVQADFRPVNRDGEVAGFELRALDDVAATVRETTRFKFNCALVVIDFLVRHGHLGPSDPDYVAIARGLRGPPAPEPPGWWWR